MSTLTEEAAKLFTDPNLGTIATIRPDGSPHVTPVWIDWDGEHVLVNTARGRAKERHLRRDPRATVLVVSPANVYAYVEVSGPAKLTEDGAAEHIQELSQRYRGVPFQKRPGEVRVIVRIRPEHVDEHGLDSDPDVLPGDRG
jgi:PPOX class probable F420-dependent enzyme